MSLHVEPRMDPTEIRSMLPTQMTFGAAQVRDLAAELAKDLRKRDAAQKLARAAVPAVLGPHDRLYVIDHHHHCLALLKVGQDVVLVRTVADLSHLPTEVFWSTMDARGWTHPYDRHGTRHEFADLPDKIEGLVDDPYRSLAGFARDAGGYAKNAEPFSEFQWAAYLRWQMHGLTDGDFRKKDRERTVERALKLARSRDARYLPGWCGER